MKYHYENKTLSDDYLFSSKGRPTKCDMIEKLEDEGWEIFSIGKWGHSLDWEVVVRKPR